MSAAGQNALRLPGASNRLHTLRRRLLTGGALPLAYSGSLVRVRGLILEAQGLEVSLGERCRISTEQNRFIDAEVVGFNGEHVQLMALGEVQGLSPGARVHRDTPLRPRAASPRRHDQSCDRRPRCRTGRPRLEVDSGRARHPCARPA